MRLLILISVLISSVYGLNILGVFLYPGKSHFFVFKPYLKELARRGHNVTIISYFPQEEPLENYVDIKLNENINAAEETITMDSSFKGLLHILLYIVKAANESCRSLLNNKQVQRLYTNGSKFDVVVMELFNNDCPLGLAHKLGAPVVGLTSTVVMPWHYERFGIRDYTIIFPLTPGGHQPNLFQRVERMISYFAINLLFKYFVYDPEEKMLKEHFDDMPPLDVLRHEMRFVLLYHHLFRGGTTSLPLNLKEVGGYHIASPRELPHDLKKYIDESEHGVIYISFGSMLRASTTPKDKVEAIIGALSELPQRVIWKWEEETLPGNPQNILLSNWLPQNDILAHPKVLAFYSHCGLLGTTEAIYHGVPMIGMPVFGDQPANAAAMEESGLGVQIQVQDLTKENLLEKLKTVLDPKFRARVKQLSKAWRDRPISAMDSAIYWTEFAARHSNFTFRTRAADVPFYQYLYLDVFLVLGSALIVVFFLLRKMFTIILSFVFRDSTKKIKSS